MADFLSTCMARAHDLGSLPAALAAAGWAEIRPEDGPPGPAIAQAPTGRRLWARSDAGGEAFTGLTTAAPDHPVTICWHVSRPGETAAAALSDLRRRYPPLGNTRATGAEFFHGGFERWGAALGADVVILGVAWALRAMPEAGTGFLFLARPLPSPGRGP